MTACQFIQITGLREGTYVLENQVNPDHLLPESSYSNNFAAVKLHYTPKHGNTPASVQVKITWDGLDRRITQLTRMPGSVGYVVPSPDSRTYLFSAQGGSVSIGGGSFLGKFLRLGYAAPLALKSGGRV